jgi:hypothetical protein
MAHSNPISGSRSVYFFHKMGIKMKTIQSPMRWKKIGIFLPIIAELAKKPRFPEVKFHGQSVLLAVPI